NQVTACCACERTRSRYQPRQTPAAFDAPTSALPANTGSGAEDGRITPSSGGQFPATDLRFPSTTFGKNHPDTSRLFATQHRIQDNTEAASSQSPKSTSPCPVPNRNTA